MAIQKVEIGSRLKELRVSKGLKQKDLANVLGITPPAYGKLEAGERGLDFEYCIKLADFYGVSCDYILRGIKTENLDICAKTCLTSETVEALVKRYANDYTMLDEYFSKHPEKPRSGIEVVNGRLVATGEDDIIADDEGDFLGFTHDEYYRNLSTYEAHKKRDYAINLLLQDESFFEDFCFAIETLGAGLRDYIGGHSLRDRRGPDSKASHLLVREGRKSLDAGRYASTRALTLFLDKLEKDPGFLKMVFPWR